MCLSVEKTQNKLLFTWKHLLDGSAVISLSLCVCTLYILRNHLTQFTLSEEHALLWNETETEPKWKCCSNLLFAASSQSESKSPRMKVQGWKWEEHIQFKDSAFMSQLFLLPPGWTTSVWSLTRAFLQIYTHKHMLTFARHKWFNEGSHLWSNYAVIHSSAWLIASVNWMEPHTT